MVILGAAMMVIANVLVAVPPPLSVTFTPKLNGPPAVGGVPLNKPPGLSDSQAGKAGMSTDHVNPAFVPPDAFSVCEYGAVASAFGNGDAVVMVGAAMIFSASVVFAVTLLLSVTWKVIFPLKTAEGVPARTPPLNVIPAGRLFVVMAHVYGGVPPEAVKVVAWYGTVTSPDGKDAGEVIVSGGGEMTRVREL